MFPTNHRYVQWHNLEEYRKFIGKVFSKNTRTMTYDGWPESWSDSRKTFQVCRGQEMKVFKSEIKGWFFTGGHFLARALIRRRPGFVGGASAGFSKLLLFSPSCVCLLACLFRGWFFVVDPTPLAYTAVWHGYENYNFSTVSYNILERISFFAYFLIRTFAISLSVRNQGQISPWFCANFVQKCN